MYDDHLLIAGDLVKGTSRLDVINPATGKVFCTVGRASPAQLDEAVTAARKAQPGWAALAHGERAARLVAFADSIHAEAEQIARTLSTEQGKPLAEAAGEIAACEATLRHLAGTDLSVETLKDDAQFLVQAHYRPLGVVAGITPWNFPLIGGITKGASALILGNTFIWKPAPTTPVGALMLARLAQPIFPAGVFNVITDNNDLGGLITAHPGIDKVSFTGSTATGKKVMASSAETLKRITLELGGNDAAIVLDDADVEKVAPQIFGCAFSNAGQVCLAIKRVYAHASIYERLCAALAKMADEMIVGEGTEQGVQMGPLQNAAQFDKARAYLEAAAADGVVIAGGAAMERDGYFIRPTVVRDIREDSRLVQEEQFSPILPVMSFDDIEDAIRRANATSYGLGGSVWSNDSARAMAVAARIDSGTVWVNQHLNIMPDVPFGGAKQSGMGVELAREGLREFAQLHVINVAKNGKFSAIPVY